MNYVNNIFVHLSPAGSQVLEEFPLCRNLSAIIWYIMVKQGEGYWGNGIDLLKTFFLPFFMPLLADTPVAGLDWHYSLALML